MVNRKKSIDAVGATERARTIFSRSVKGSLQIELLERAVGLLDLTSLEGTDTPDRIRALANRGLRPDIDVGSVAAVCVYPARAMDALEVLAGSGVKVAAVAGAFPSGLSVPEIVIADVAHTAALGVDEIDIVMDRSLFFAGKYDEATMMMAKQIEVAGVPVKVILETGELGTLENISLAAQLAIDAGASFVKTSTGKISVGATPEAVYVIASTIADHVNKGGRPVGIKVSGGVKTTREALGYITLIAEKLGTEWIQPDLLRIGASTLLDDICMQLRFHRDGRYPSANHIPRS
jgi:deoxyribose-phosphate aldolase